MRVLHITESLGGGVTTAVNSYVKNSPSFEHYLFASVRESDITGEESIGKFNKIELVSRGWRAILELKKFIHEINPNVIHVHSTYAGFFVRIFFNKNKIPIIYTPHGFSFLRDDNVLFKKVYYFIEKMLSYRATVIAGCSKDEANIAAGFSSDIETFELVNVCDSLNIESRTPQRSGELVIGMGGRVTNQKGYRFFAQVAKRTGEKAKFVWIGGGDAQAVLLLKKAGVKVTGWLTRSEVIDQLSGLDVYFHSAAWDGFPVSVLEAAEVRRPLVLRDIGAFSSEGLYTVRDTEHACEELCALIGGDLEAWHRAENNKDMILLHHTNKNLYSALTKLYVRYGKAS